MKRLLLSFFIILSYQAFTQNYKPIIEGQESYYIKPNGEIEVLNAARVDTIGSDTILHNLYRFKSDDNTCDNPNGNWGSYNFYSTSLAGGKIRQQPSGTWTFHNQSEATITLHTIISVGDSWTAYSFENGDYIEATLSDIVEASVLGNPDSIKVLSLQVKDLTGANIAHDFNGKEIHLSKNNGLVKTYDFGLFPDDTVSHVLTNKTRLTRREVYDWNAGDVVQIHIDGGGLGVSDGDTNTYITKTVLSKNYSLGQDTVELVLKRDFIIYNAEFVGPYPPTIQSIDTIVYSDTISTTYDLLSQYILDPYMPGESYYFDSLKLHPTNYDLSSMPSLYNGRRVMRNTVSFDLYSYGNDTCWFGNGWSDAGTKWWTYIEGLGHLYSSLDAGHGYSESIVYYKKGNDTYGTLFTAIEENELPNIEAKLYPNPTNEELNITFTQPILDTTLDIYDTVGKLVLSKQNVNGNQLRFDLDLESGVYFVHVSAKNHKTFARKLVIK